MKSGWLTRRQLLDALLQASAVGAISSSFATAQSSPASASLVEDLVVANLILAQQGILDNYGHVSVRHDAGPNRYLLARSLAPALVTAADIQQYDLDSNPLDPRGTPFIHRAVHPWRDLPGATRHPRSCTVILRRLSRSA